MIKAEENSVAGAFQHSDCGPAAEDVLVGAAGTGDADAADNHHTVDDRDAAAHGHDAATMRDSEAPNPRLPRLGRHFGCRKVKSSSGVSLMESEFRRSGLGAVHFSHGNR